MANRLHNAKIFKVVNDIDSQLYVGYTTVSVERAFEYLKKDAEENTKEMLILDHMRNIGVEHFRAELIEDYPCNTLDEIRLRKHKWVLELNATLNGNVFPQREYRSRAPPPHRPRSNSASRSSSFSADEKAMLHRLYWKVFPSDEKKTADAIEYENAA